MRTVYSLQEVEVREMACLSVVSQLSDEPQCKLFLAADAAPERSRFDGVITAIFRIGGRDVGLVLNDFRMNGGSFGTENSQRVTKFFDFLDRLSIPCVYIANSSGVRIMEGRRVFDAAFGLLPALKRFSERNLLLTFAMGKCIGLGAVIFGYGQCRIAIRETGQINLTGPEVFKMFFSSDAEFEQAACPERSFAKSQFVQEIVDTKEQGLRRIRDLLLFAHGYAVPASLGRERCAMGEGFEAPLLNPSIDRLESVMESAGEERLEVFAEMSPVVRTYLVRRRGCLYGLFVNPPGHPANMISSVSIVRFLAALEFFKRLKLPIVSMLDSPGGDPRVAESDKNFVGLYIQVINKIIEYDQPKLGILIGRCFGGASVLGFPRIFGSNGVLAVKNAQVGIMHSATVDRLLDGVPRLAAQWEEVKRGQHADLRDLIAQRSIDRVIAWEDIGREIGAFLSELGASPALSVVEFPKESKPPGRRLPLTEAQ